jgi:hypothetical protein
MALEGTVKTPLGPMKKKTAMIAGGGAIVLIGVVYYRSKQAAAANAAATSAAATTDANTGQSGMDPATGFPYGSAEDAAALAQQGGIGYTYGGGGSGSTGQYPTGTGPPFTTNAAWGQYCEQTMGSSGSDPIAAAIGHYLTGSPLQSGESTIVDQAIAVGGYPPTAGPNGFPPGLNTNNPTTGGTVKVPNVVGMETGAGDRVLVAAGLQFAHPELTPAGSTITFESPKAGTMVNPNSTVTLTIKEKKR